MRAPGSLAHTTSDHSTRMSHGLSLSAKAAQQVQNLVQLARTHCQNQLIPRLDSARSRRTTTTCVELKFLSCHPDANTKSIVSITIEIRLPVYFPVDTPMIACVAGGEHLPDSMCADGQLSLPWIQNGWPIEYTLVQCAEDICAQLRDTSDETRPCFPPMSSPTLQQPYYHEQFPTASQVVNTPQPWINFRCKWCDSTCEFDAIRPPSYTALLALLYSHVPGLSAHAQTRVAEFNTSRSGALLSNDLDWQRVLSSRPRRVHILILTPEQKKMTPISTVDLLGIEHASDSQEAHNLLSPSPSSQGISSVIHPISIVDGARRISWRDLQMSGVIGQGSSCRVYRATWRGTDVAVKVFTGPDRANVDKEFTNEVHTMVRLGAHPSLVIFLAVTHQPRSIVFEYLPFSLFELINGVDDKTRNLPLFPRSWTKRVTMMLDVAKGLQFLHSFEIIHRDMKSLNLLVTPEGRVKLADFGISRIARTADAMTGCCGTFQWMAPEVLQSSKYSVSADIYSFGIVMWEICEAAAPFADMVPAMVPVAVLRDKKRPPFSTETPQQLQALIRSCWQEDPAKRPSAAQVVCTLQGFFHSG